MLIPRKFFHGKLKTKNRCKGKKWRRKTMTTGNAPVGGRSTSAGTASSTRAPKKPRLPKKEAEMVRQQALREAEALFKGKRGRPEYRTGPPGTGGPAWHQEVS